MQKKKKRTEDVRFLREIKSSNVISRKYTDRERWFKWIVSLTGPGATEDTTLRPCLWGIVLVGSNEGGTNPGARVLDWMEAEHQHSFFFIDCHQPSPDLAASDVLNMRNCVLNQHKPSLPKVAFVKVFSHIYRKITNRDTQINMFHAVSLIQGDDDL